MSVVGALKALLKKCTLCPRNCRVDRAAGEKGFCGLSDEILMDCAMAHFGEEPPLTGTGGAGTVFLSSCNLKCIYCQNYRISHRAAGTSLDAAGLAKVMLDLQARGCHNIEPVTPTPQLPGIIEALLTARSQGLTVPFVYNCGGYESPDVIGMLDGVVDIYLPDFKYGLDEDGLMLSGVGDYPRWAAAALREMVRQVGEALEMEGDIARRGVLIRHLVLPGKTENSMAVLDMIREHVSPAVALSLMSQYTPIPAVRSHPVLGRRVSRAEYDRVVRYALDSGFENVFVQEVDERHLSPDFGREYPFQWEDEK
jgi:putative pyruvate formate lyase activating enzyme